MDLDYRKVEFTEEMSSLLSGYVQHKWPILVWQTHTRSDAREGVVTDVQPFSNSIAVSIQGKPQLIDMNKPLYCKGEEKKLIFKSVQFTTLNNNFKIVVPPDARLAEMRAAPRYDMFNNKKGFLTVSVMSHYESKESSFVFKLNEISKTGASVIMSSGNIQHFHVGDTIKVIQVGSDIVHIPIRAQIKYLYPIQKKGQADIQLYQIGLKFTEEISFYSYYLTKNLS